MENQVIFALLKSCSYKGYASEVVGVVADYVVDVRKHELCGENVSHRVHVAVEEERLSELCIVVRAVLKKVDDVAVVEEFGKLQYRTAHICGFLGTVGVSVRGVGLCHKEELCVRLNLLVTLNYL